MDAYILVLAILLFLGGIILALGGMHRENLDLERGVKTIQEFKEKLAKEEELKKSAADAQGSLAKELEDARAQLQELKPRLEEAKLEAEKARGEKAQEAETYEGMKLQYADLERQTDDLAGQLRNAAQREQELKEEIERLRGAGVPQEDRAPQENQESPTPKIGE